MKSNRFLKLTGFAKHIRTRTLLWFNPKSQFYDDIFDLKTPLRNFVLCLVLKWFSSKVLFIFSHGYADRVDICHSTFMIFAYAECSCHKCVRKSALISNSLPWTLRFLFRLSNTRRLVLDLLRMIITDSMALTTEKAALITEAWMDAFPETTKTQHIILYQTEICDLMMDHIMAINAVVDTSGTPTLCHVNQPIELSFIQWSNGSVDHSRSKA